MEEHRRYEEKLEASLLEYDEFVRVEKLKYDSQVNPETLQVSKRRPLRTSVWVL